MLKQLRLRTPQWPATGKWPEFRVEEAAHQSRPAGRNVLVPRSDSAENGDPEVSATCTEAPRAATEGVAD
eukprot:6526048-Alexandrium_andersonii.AAC.1